ncbi:YveK family protein [Mycolicibacterium phlei]
MKPPAFVPKVRDYLRTLVQGWWIILCATVLSGLMGWLVYSAGPHQYQASAQLFVLTPGNATTIDAYYGQLNAAMRAPTFTGLARSSQVTMRTIEQLGLAETPDGLAARIAVLPKTQVVLDVSVVGIDPDQTRATAEAVVENMVALAHQLNSVETGDTELVPIDDGAATVQRLESRTTLIAEGAGIGFALSALLVIAYGLIRDKLIERGQVGRLIDEFRAVSDE